MKKKVERKYSVTQVISQVKDAKAYRSIKETGASHVIWASSLFLFSSSCNLFLWLLSTQLPVSPSGQGHWFFPQRPQEEREKRKKIERMKEGKKIFNLGKFLLVNGIPMEFTCVSFKPSMNCVRSPATEVSFGMSVLQGSEEEECFTLSKNLQVL